MKDRIIKPILVIKAPARYTGKDISKIGDALKPIGLNEDYHVLIILTEAGVDFEFQGLFPKDFPEQSFEELKKELKAKIAILRAS